NVDTGKSRGWKKVEIKVAPGGRSARLTGVLEKSTGLFSRRGPLPNLVAYVTTTQVRRSPVSRSPDPVGSYLKVPGSAVLALPPCKGQWENCKPSFKFTLESDQRVVWEGLQLPRGVPVLVQNRPCTLTATLEGDKVRVDLTEVRPGGRPVN